MDELMDVVEARPLENYRIWLRFEDGVEGVVDVSDLVGQGVFAAWRDIELFRSMRVDPEAGTVVWPGDLDLAPDALYDAVRGVRPLPD